MARSCLTLDILLAQLDSAVACDFAVACCCSFAVAVAVAVAVAFAVAFAVAVAVAVAGCCGHLSLTRATQALIGSYITL